MSDIVERLKHAADTANANEDDIDFNMLSAAIGTVRRLRAEKSELRRMLHSMTDVYWGVEDDRNGDGGPPPLIIQEARAVLSQIKGE